MITLFGDKHDPSTWRLLEPDEHINGMAFVQDKNLFVRDFPDFLVCRKWVIEELAERKKAISRSYGKWLRKQN